MQWCVVAWARQQPAHKPSVRCRVLQWRLAWTQEDKEEKFILPYDRFRNVWMRFCDINKELKRRGRVKTKPSQAT